MRTKQLCKSLLLFLLVLAIAVGPLQAVAGAGEGRAREAAADVEAGPRLAVGPVAGGASLTGQALARAPWITETVEATGFVGQYTSVALDTAGRPHISYYDATNADLKYARYVGSGGNCGPAPYYDTWQCVTVEATGSVGTYTSLALDQADVPRISYMDATNTDLKYARYVGSGGNCGPGNNTWRCEVVDNNGNTGYYTSLVLDASGNPHISYYSGIGAEDLRYAYYNGTSWTVELVDTAGSVGYYSSLALDAGGNPHISYYYATTADLRYAYKDGTSWVIQTIDGSTPPLDVGVWTSITLDPLSGAPAISYIDNSYANLKYARYVGTGGNCGPGNTSWRCETVAFVGVPGAGRSTSLALGGNGQPHVSFSGPERDLLYAYYDGTAWTTEAVDWVGDQGAWSSLALDASYGIHISYLDATHNDLRYASGCKPVQAATIAGPSLLLVGDEGSYTAAYHPPAATRPITITWDDGTVGPSAVYSWTTPGVKTITVTATNPCGQAVGTYTVTVCQPVEAVSVAGPTWRLTGQVGHYTATALPPDRTPPVSYLWDNGATQPTSDYSWATPGDKTIAVTATNPCGQARGAYTVTVYQPVTGVEVAGPDFVLVGQVVTYTATALPPNASPPVTYLWSNGATEPTAHYSWTEPGVYSVVVTATNLWGQAEKSYPVTVCQPVQAVNIAGPDWILAGDVGNYEAAAVPPDATGPITYTWSNGTVSRTAYYSWTEPGHFTVIVTATNPCSDPVTGTLGVDVCQPVTDVVVSGPAELGVNEVGQYHASHEPPDANGPVTFVWDNGAVGPDAQYSWPSAGLYTITVTATNPCDVEVVETFQVSVVCRALSSVSISGPDVLLLGEEGRYTATVLPANATAPVTVTWSNGMAGVTTTYSWDAEGLYTITVTATNPCGPVVTGTYAVSVTSCKPVQSVAIVGPDVLLVNEAGTYTATLQPLHPSEPVTVTWSDGTAGYTATYSWGMPGLYTIAVTATNSCGPVVTDTFAVSVTLCKPVSSVAIAGPEVLLVDEEGTYTAGYTPPNASEPVTVTWSNGTVSLTAVYSWSAEGLYTITVTATNICGPVITDTLAVSVTVCRPLSGVALSGPDVLPVGQVADYTASPEPWDASPPLTYTWSNGTLGSTAAYSWTETGRHTVTVTATNLCSGPLTGRLGVEVCRPVSVVTVSGPPILQVRQEGTYVAAYSPTNATLPITFTWNNGSVGPSAVYSWTVAGSHLATATATSICGAVPGSTSVTVYGRVYLPLVIRAWDNCFLGNDYNEDEPNNNAGQANGPLCSGQEYYGLADDTYDMFYIYSGAGTVHAVARNYTATDPQLVLYDEDMQMICRDWTLDPDLSISCPVSERGKYFVMLYALGGYNTTDWYTLTVTYP